MPAIYKIKATRSNLSDIFPTENGKTFVNDSSTLAQYVGLNFEESTLLTPGKENIVRYEEVITWNEIWERRNELQPIDKALAESSWDNGDNAYTAVSQYAPYNPFTLTHTQILVFDTIENLITSYNNVLTDDKVTEIVSDAIATNNVITDEVFVDGNIYSGLSSKFAGRF